MKFDNSFQLVILVNKYNDDDEEEIMELLFYEMDSKLEEIKLKAHVDILEYNGNVDWSYSDLISENIFAFRKNDKKIYFYYQKENELKNIEKLSFEETGLKYNLFKISKDNKLYAVANYPNINKGQFVLRYNLDTFEEEKRVKLKIQNNFDVTYIEEFDNSNIFIRTGMSDLAYLNPDYNMGELRYVLDKDLNILKDYTDVMDRVSHVKKISRMINNEIYVLWTEEDSGNVEFYSILDQNGELKKGEDNFLLDALKQENPDIAKVQNFFPNKWKILNLVDDQNINYFVKFVKKDEVVDELKKPINNLKEELENKEDSKEKEEILKRLDDLEKELDDIEYNNDKIEEKRALIDNKVKEEKELVKNLKDKQKEDNIKNPDTGIKTNFLILFILILSSGYLYYKYNKKVVY